MACRWIWEACRCRRWEYRLVTPDSYRDARTRGTIDDLFSVEQRGIVFFDDMDLALRDRERGQETEDQAVFLSAMDGITAHEGVAFVFTTNCSLDLIDRAFKRPGRLDVVLHFNPPDETLRRQLFDRWHEDIRAALDLERAVAETEGYSFAEVEELKNLLVMRFMEVNEWDWGWAVKQFEVNRSELTARNGRSVGFSQPTPSRRQLGFGRRQDEGPF
jgi:AAA+ superfamily predicted ATPase